MIQIYWRGRGGGVRKHINPGCHRLLIFQIKNSFRSYRLSLKYQKFTPQVAFQFVPKLSSFANYLCGN